MVARDPRRIALVLVALVLAGATLFGLWHVAIGGLVNGNARAATFGVGLALIAGGLLSVTVRIARRERRG